MLVFSLLWGLVWFCLGCFLLGVGSMLLTYLEHKRKEKKFKVVCKTPPKIELKKAPFSDYDLYE